MSEYWTDYREVGRYVREENRQKSLAVFAESTNLAELHGLTLRRLSDVHYQLSNGGWLLNIYPGNQRIMCDKNKGRAPWVNVDSPWTVLDIVSRVVEMEGESNE